MDEIGEVEEQSVHRNFVDEFMNWKSKVATPDP